MAPSKESSFDLDALEPEDRSSFLAMFSVYPEFTVFTFPDGTDQTPTFSKIECEREDWKTWYFDTLAPAGLIEIEQIAEGEAKGMAPGSTWKKYKFTVTPLGHDIRDSWYAVRVAQ